MPSSVLPESIVLLTARPEVPVGGALLRRGILRLFNPVRAYVPAGGAPLEHAPAILGVGGSRVATVLLRPFAASGDGVAGFLGWTGASCREVVAGIRHLASASCCASGSTSGLSVTARLQAGPAMRRYRRPPQ